MANEIKSVQYFNPNDPSGSKNLAQQMMAAQLQEQLAQQQMQSGSEQPQGQYIPGNSQAPGIETRVNPLANLAAALTKVSGAYGQKEAMTKQIDLQQAMMQRQFQAMQGAMGGVNAGGQAGTGGGQGTDPTIQKAMMMQMMGASPELVKGVLDYGSPTTEMKNAGASGQPNPVALAGALKGQEQANTIFPNQTVNGREGVPVTGAQIMGQGIPQQTPMAPNHNVPPSLPQQSAAPQDPMQEFHQAQAQQQAITGVSPGQNAADAQNVAPMSGFGVPIGQKEGSVEAQKNYQTYLQGLNKQVKEGADNTRIMNAQEDLMTHFRPGAGEEELAQAAAAAKTMGMPQSMVDSISRGDNAALGAVQAFSSMASIHAAKQALEMMSSGGNGQPRIAASVLQDFKENLSNPNKQADAIKEINALSRQQYMADFQEQQSSLHDKGDPTTFQQRYAAQIQPQLMNGRSADPAAVANQTSTAAPAGAPAGGKIAPDGNYYIPDQSRPGKYLMWKQ